MKYSVIAIFALLAVCSYVRSAEDCNSPLLDKTVNTNAPEGAKGTEVQTAPNSIKYCRHLVGKSVCCSESQFSDLDDAFKKFKSKMEGKRKQQLQGVQNIENDLRKNKAKDADNFAKA